MLELRPYQQDMLAQARQHLRAGIKRIILQASTGAGKTASATAMIAGSLAKGNRVWFVVHRREIIADVSRRFDENGLRHGMVQPGRPLKPDEKLQVCSIQTLRLRAAMLPPPTLIVMDECHHAVSASYLALLALYPDVPVIGLTATPERLDGRGLGEVFQAIVPGPPMRWLIEQGFISDYKYFSVALPDTSGLHSRAGDYIAAEVEALMDQPAITGDIVSTYQQRADGKRAMAFCAGVKHAKHVAETFAAAGYRAVSLDGNTPPLIRDRIMDEYRAGQWDIMAQCDLLGEGVDVPGIECAILLRPTKSLTIYLQSIGRALRSAPGKTHAIILDHVGNWITHLMPDEERVWSLDAKKRSPPKDQEPTYVRCKACFAVYRATCRECPECGEAKPAPKPRKVSTRDGELSEIDPAALRLIKHGSMRDALLWATDEAGLRIVAKVRGYHPGWVKHVLNSRAQEWAKRMTPGHAS